MHEKKPAEQPNIAIIAQRMILEVRAGILPDISELSHLNASHPSGHFWAAQVIDAILDNPQLTEQLDAAVKADERTQKPGQSD